MRRRIGLLAFVGFFGLFAAANAQRSSPSTAGGPFDGTYRFVSSAKLNATYVTRNGRTGPCPDRRAGPLHVEAGRGRTNPPTGDKTPGSLRPPGGAGVPDGRPTKPRKTGFSPTAVILNAPTRAVPRVP